MNLRTGSSLISLSAAIFLYCASLDAQVYRLSFDQRVSNSPIIALVKVTEKQSYWDDKKANIRTRNVLEVRAWLKGYSSAATIVALSPGGVVDDQAEFVCPAEVYELNKEYLVLLKENTTIVDDKKYRAANRDVKQCLSYAGIQSVLPFETGLYKDIPGEIPMTEQQLVDRMKRVFGLDTRRPDGTIYKAREFSPGTGQRTTSISSITDGTGSLPATGFVNGTIAANNELIINGTGFGATTGSVQFANINDGGATNISTVAATDIISWSNTQIRTKIPGNAGTGTLIVLDNTSTNVGSTPITIKWGEINVTNTFLNFGTSQRQQVHLLDRNGLGGYTFEYSTNTTNGPSFFADAAAKAAFGRAVKTWRCSSLVNFNVLSSSGNAAGYVNDNINVVLYDDVGLPAGALGVCTSRFSASGIGGTCDNFNTVWYLKEMDIQVLSVPVPGFTWNFTTGAPTGSQFDFESVMLHEIGHGHGLTHINLASSPMFWTITNGTTNRSPGANETEAGQYRITQSNSNCLNTNGVGGFTPHAAISFASCNTLLPLTLLDFSGQKNPASITLQWITEFEENTRGFYIEKSTDGQQFNAIGFVATTGTYSRHTYNFTDNSNLLPGVVYYRLKIQDKDNSFRYSRVIQFRNEATGNWKLFPNPVFETINIVPGKIYTGKALLEIVDLTGRIIQSQKLSSLSPGIVIPVSVKRLPAGVYAIKIMQGPEVLLVQRFSKQ